MYFQWVLWCSTNQQRKAEKLLERAVAALEGSADTAVFDYDVDIPGYSVTFHTSASGPSREARIVEAIALCEKLGSQWVLDGSVHRVFSLVTRKTFVPGIVVCECYLYD